MRAYVCVTWQADKMAAIRALEARSLEFMREKEEKRYEEPQA